MNHTNRLVLATLTAAVALVLAGCDLTTAMENDERYGEVLAASEVDDCPAGFLPYVTAPGDTLFQVAERIYGDGRMKYYVTAYPMNKEKVAEITKDDGTLEPGKILFLPPYHGEQWYPHQTYPQGRAGG